MKLYDVETFNLDFLRDRKFLVDNKFTKEFLSLMIFYRQAFEAYISKFIDIQKCECIFKETIHEEIEVASSQRNIYQTASTFSYFYLRNNVHLERLSEKELSFLKEKQQTGLFDDELFAFIKKTYKIVFCYSLLYDSNDLIHYEYTFESLYVENASLLFHIQYDIFLKKRDNFKEFFFQVQEASQVFKNELKKLSSNFDVPVYIEIYPSKDS